ncbi:MAG: phosphate ABC transporter permease PstA [Nitrospirota bacterium]|jgi:phosphate transport system permease protein
MASESLSTETRGAGLSSLHAAASPDGDRAPNEGGRSHRPGTPANRGGPPATPDSAGAASRLVRRRRLYSAHGEPLLWLIGGALGVAVLMIAGLLLLVVLQGAHTFWPRPIVEVTTTDGHRYLGAATRTEVYPATAKTLAALPAEARETIVAAGGLAHRRLIHTGNFDLTGTDFVWVADHEVADERRPGDALLVERMEWGPFVGYLTSVRVDGEPEVTGPAAWQRFQELHPVRRAAARRIQRLTEHDLGDVNLALEKVRLDLRAVSLRRGEDSPAYQEAAARVAAQEQSLHARYEEIRAEINRLEEEGRRYAVRLTAVDGRSKEIPIDQVVRAVAPNRMDLTAKLKVYFSRWWEFLSADPREANTEGGVFPAIFGTAAMTLLMSFVVGPFGVVAAVYLREYARQGLIISLVRIAVNNLAGVPSIVFGVFGLGFFCYLIGGTIDQLFFAARLPSPTFGTGGILWASLTLALLTLPVVIVATEEALAAVPSSVREGSLACGASQWQTLRRIVLPRAMPGILTGLILAMARGAGEVAPLMLTGVVKLAPELPFDHNFPYLHLERSFMHLGFHIYDVGFQSRNAEAGKPMVFTTTLLLILLILVLNVVALWARRRLGRRFKEATF